MSLAPNYESENNFIEKNPRTRKKNSQKYLHKKMTAIETDFSFKKEKSFFAEYYPEGIAPTTSWNSNQYQETFYLTYSQTMTKNS